MRIERTPIQSPPASRREDASSGATPEQISSGRQYRGPYRLAVQTVEIRSNRAKSAEVARSSRATEGVRMATKRGD
jgi:hypothetical protein